MMLHAFFMLTAAAIASNWLQTACGFAFLPMIPLGGAKDNVRRVGWSLCHGNNRSYSLRRFRRSWTGARADCEWTGGGLAVPHNEIDINCIDGLTKGIRDTWIGLHKMPADPPKTQSFFTTDCEARLLPGTWLSTKWAEGRPRRHDSNCVSFWRQNNIDFAGFDDDDCTREYFFLCEKQPPPPPKVEALERGKFFINVQVHPSRNTGNYPVHYMLFYRYSDFNVPYSSRHVGDTSETYVIHNLLPNRRLLIYAEARNDQGATKSSIIEVATSQDRPAKPTMLSLRRGMYFLIALKVVPHGYGVSKYCMHVVELQQLKCVTNKKPYEGPFEKVAVFEIPSSSDHGRGPTVFTARGWLVNGENRIGPAAEETYSISGFFMDFKKVYELLGTFATCQRLRCLETAA